ncbi:DUF998 domain-containing protein [Nonomuraea sediminis]|uniref:DUF998 domain-containing protein n=1 Tax=Nonomuraea sediminis TaxID=2835864 RepID=UPI001BDDA71E|nr:DUF998 domain-containing protein [Nonomuraea sediminis]
MTTPRLLACGLVAGPLFLAVYLVQAFTREGFDPAYHPLSLLSLGGPGWIQIANFVVTGLLYVGFAAGMRRAIDHARGGTWGPLLFGIVGLGLVTAGVFTTDAGAGFPPGAPAGAPEMSRHGMVHEVGFVLASLPWFAGCLVLVVRKVVPWWWLASPVGVLVVDAWPDQRTLSLRLVIGTAVQFAFMVALAVRLLRQSRRLKLIDMI